MNTVSSSALIIAVVAVFATVVAAYDFSDSNFNQLLARDLDVLYSAIDRLPNNVRNRRDTDDEDVNNDNVENDGKKCGPPPPPGHHGPHHAPCCGDSIFDAIRDANKDTMKACFKETMEKDGADEKPDPFDCGKRRMHMVCNIECIFKKQNMIDSDGNLDEAKVTAYVKDAFKDATWFQSVQDTVISNCLNSAKNFKPKDETKMPCKPYAMIFKHCLFSEAQLQCPDAEIKDKDSCTKFKEHIKKKKEEKDA